MELKEIQKSPENIKSVILSVRTTPKLSKWMKENYISPSKLFNCAIEDLMNKGGNSNE